MYSRLLVLPNGISLAHARARWLHRWSRKAGWVLGLRNRQRGFAPVSGIVVASYGTLLDAVLLAAIQPCVFVAGAGVRRLPLIGFLARLGGTIFVDCPRRRSLLLTNFQIQRALNRRLIVVIFPGCGKNIPTRTGEFNSALFQPAVELGCTLTAASIDYRDDSETRPVAKRVGAFTLALRMVTRWRRCATLSFSGPTFLHGDRKQLAFQLWFEHLALMANTRVESNS
jgi:1-acyl-sn-glycerol-3-phosphate acyltransferase